MLFDRLKSSSKYRPGDNGVAVSGADSAGTEVFNIDSSLSAVTWCETVASLSGGTNNGALNRGAAVNGAGGSTTIKYINIDVPFCFETFGSLSISSKYSGCSSGSNDRGIFASDSGTSIHYITLSTIGNATNFGTTNLTASPAALSNGSNDKAILSYGTSSSSFIMSTGGTATSFGSLQRGAGAGNSTSIACSSDLNERGIIGPNSYNASLEYLTISSASNAVIFGNDIYGGASVEIATMSNGVGEKGICVGCFVGVGVPATIKSARLFNILSLTSAVNVGDLTYARKSYGGFSNGYA